MTLVLAAIDNSAAARPVLLAARALAMPLGADVDALYVSAKKGETARGCAESMRIRFRQLVGDPLEKIVAESNSPGVVAVAIGARHRVKERGLGHLARQVADSIDKPVLVVPPNSPPIERFRTVLIAMEGTPERSRDVKATISVVVASGLDLVVLHVDDEASLPSFSDQPAHETEAYAKEFLARYLPGAPTARLELRIGSPAEEIVSAVAGLDADLIAIGWPQKDGPSRGRNVREVLDRSRVPVLLVALEVGAAAESRAPRECMSI